MTSIRVGVIGDYDGRPTHLATNEALQHCASALGASADVTWLATESLAETGFQKIMCAHDAFWCAPGSPYKSMDGALRAVRYAREGGHPFIGTCGGFQHVVLEYARNVLGFIDADHAEYDPYASNPFITPLSCSPFGRTMKIYLEPDSSAYQFYGMATAEEEYRCNFGLDEARQRMIHEGGLRVVATDQDGEARILELPGHPFFMATLFVPQTTSRPEQPHPLIVAFLRATQAVEGKPDKKVGQAV